MLDHWSWRAMLVAEGSLPFLWLVIWLKFVQDRPAEAAWMPESERVPLVETLRREHSELEGQEKVPYLRALLRPRVFLLAAVYFCFINGQMGLLFCLPSSIENFKKLTSFSTGNFYTLPFIVRAVSLLIISRPPERPHERRYHATGAR